MDAEASATKRNTSAARLEFDLPLLSSACRALKLWFPQAPPTEQKEEGEEEKKTLPKRP